MLKKGRQWAALLAAATLSVSVIGCGNSESVQNTQTNTEKSDESVSENSDVSDEDEEDVASIEMAFYSTMVPNDENISRIEEAINAITVPEIHTEVNISVISMGQWDQQMNLIMSSGEQLDLMPTFFGGSTAFGAMSSGNKLTPLNDLLEAYGQGILETLPENYLDTTTINGKTLGRPYL